MFERLVLRFWIHLSVLLFILVTLASLYPLPSFPELPGKDKTAHLIAYCALALPVSVAKPRRLYQVLLLYVIWSGLIELIQPYVNRYGEFADFLANTGGLALGLILGLAIRNLFHIQKIG